MKVVAFVPAKGTSSRIENKNTRLLDGKPLFLYTLEKLAALPFIDEVYLDTESEEMAALAAHSGVRILMRDPALASNSTDGHALFYNEVRQVEADVYIQALCTAPFIRPETIKAAVDALQPGSTYDSVVLVRKEKHYAWKDGEPLYGRERIPNSVDLPDTVIETMGMYIVAGEAARRTRRRIGDRPLLQAIDPLEAIDVNWPVDLDLANLVAAGMREKERKLLGNLRHHLSSSLLSDTLDDVGYPAQIIKGLTPNLPDARAFGRAKTLRLRRLEPGEDFTGVYGALESYRHIVPNDIVVVQNDAPDYAYFGEINASLAVRAGAVAAVIGGHTRDSMAVAGIGFPVFARGTTCQDVRTRAVLDALNVPVTIEGVPVTPGDLLFADREGVVVVPRRAEDDVLSRALQRSVGEKRLLVDIAHGLEVDALTERHGFF
ncbi:MAG TPA: NTP transferase domain-containing protein [Luteitalea sp.]|nr:NTP transferase domain-containing protein [Luteitalea sp.]